MPFVITFLVWTRCNRIIMRLCVLRCWLCRESLWKSWKFVLHCPTSTPKPNMFCSKSFSNPNPFSKFAFPFCLRLQSINYFHRITQQIHCLFNIIIHLCFKTLSSLYLSDITSTNWSFRKIIVIFDSSPTYESYH